MADCENSEAVANFRGFLRIPSVSKNGPFDKSYERAVDFIDSVAKKYGFATKRYQFVRDKPILVVTREGSCRTKKSILFNCHYDVVPVAKEMWAKPPFGAEIDSNGNIFGRGSQDMKCIGIMVIEALKNIKQRFSRTVHVSFTPDEEIGSVDGMKIFSESCEFRKLNVGMSFDEGIPSESDTYHVFLDERVPWWLEIRATGETGHASIPRNNTALHKVIKFAERVSDYNNESVKTAKTIKELGERTTISLSDIHSGTNFDDLTKTPPNVIPPCASVTIDARITPKEGTERFLKRIKKWIKEASGCEEGMQIRYIQKTSSSNPTADNSEPFEALSTVLGKMNKKYEKCVFPGATDSRFLRKIGIPAVGFTPVIDTKIRLHDNNEYLNVKQFYEGIKIYSNLIEKLALD
ncbi:adenylate cyclase [Bonamia ostreae]|uniref:N-acyl-aliphatic-L-amino acid amidohydrolase n=1 Tax=Bonamia ostreae TaxID=126728 RepID=A0ABV2AJZ4_9EUKA